MITPIERMVDQACGYIEGESQNRLKKTEFIDHAGKTLLNLADVAEQWWREKRPTKYDEAAHLEDPTVSCSGKELELAKAVAEWCKIN